MDSCIVEGSCSELEHLAVLDSLGSIPDVADVVGCHLLDLSALVEKSIHLFAQCLTHNPL